MAQTTKASRAAPQRRFENYVLTRTTSPDVALADIPDSAMTPVIAGNVTDATTSLLNIGFDFSFDNITYKRFIVNNNGWLALAGPTEVTSGSIVTSLLLSESYQNEGINLTNVSRNVLVCPWFDSMRTVTNTVSNLTGTIGAQKANRISQGIEAPPATFNQTNYGVRIFNDERSQDGRRLIVRWTCVNDYAATPFNNIVKFDAVIYENGKIEFRYAPRNDITLTEASSSISDTYVQDATVGIFVPGTNRFRDFSPGLGHNDNRRRQYKYGGAEYDASYADAGLENVPTSHFVSRPYSWRLRTNVHWPSSENAGSIFTFSPPVNKRRVLPRTILRTVDAENRLPTVVRTGGTKRKISSFFDDRKTVVYVDAGFNQTTQATTGALVNFPTTLQRFHGGTTPGVVERQNLFVGDFEFTASVSKQASDDFVNQAQASTIKPWSEHKLFAADQAATTDPFFSGSNIEQLGDGLSQPLRAKTQLRFSLPVNFTTTMFGITSSIYYYNAKSKCWEIPQNSVTPISELATTMPANSKGDLVKYGFGGGAGGGGSLESMRGFNALGSAVVSGSRSPVFGLPQTDTMINASYSTENVATALTKTYAKSISNNEDYRATSDEVLALPINHDFLIEKAIIDIPLAFGDGWFDDITTGMQYLQNSILEVSGAFDIGGPALTVSLFNQFKLGNQTRRELIMTGTITHVDDNVAKILITNFPPITNTFHIRQQGIKAFNVEPAAVVTPLTTSGGTMTFTGSVPVKMVAMTSNGVTVNVMRSMNLANTQLNLSGVLELFNTPKLQLGSFTTTNYDQQTRMPYINNFGRGATGFEHSGRSLFGKEFSSSHAFDSQGKITNPFYLSEGAGGLTGDNIASKLSATRPQIAQAFNTGSRFISVAAIPLESKTPSPYLVKKSDTLVLAISKTRPVFFDTSSGATSGSIVHDVQLVSGAINITLYGSLIKEGREYHDTLNQPLSSDAIHEITIGSDPVLDDIDANYRELYASGTYDDYVAGSLVRSYTLNGVTALITGSRGRVFSRIAPSEAQAPGISAFDQSLSVAYRLQPHKEKAGNVRLSQHSDITERYWDSMMPAIDQCFKANGAGIFLLTNHPSADYLDLDCGFILFDQQDPLEASPIIDNSWTWSFPFEPRYSHISRLVAIEKSFYASYVLDVLAGLKAIQPKQIKGFLFGPSGTDYASVPPIAPAGILSGSVYGTHSFMFLGDSKLDYNITGSAAVADVARALYGFGDLNNVMYSNSTETAEGVGARFGTNHFADARLMTKDPATIWPTSPLIRGWKYGVASGLPLFSKAYFRQGRYGQFRDMLEQRPVTKFYQSAENKPTTANFKPGQTQAAVTVRFVDSAGQLTNPANTWSNNMSFEATSSLPYFDGESRSRPDIDMNTLNSSVVSFSSDDTL